VVEAQAFLQEVADNHGLDVGRCWTGQAILIVRAWQTGAVRGRIRLCSSAIALAR